VSAGETYLTAGQLLARARELGAEITRDYEGRDLVLVVPLRGCFVFAVDLSRAILLPHELDFVELEPFHRGERGVRLVKDLDGDIRNRHVLIAVDVVDTGLTMHYLCRTLRLRNPASISIAALLDRPYRRLVDDLPVGYLGFTVPDELYRNLPDLHIRAA
jgi:hypoxanthine phosphoribosyltransferase